jgi:hypothetical protein
VYYSVPIFKDVQRSFLFFLEGSCQIEFYPKIILLRQSILNLDSLMCSSGCGKEESAEHLFFKCDFLLLSCVLLNCTQMHALQFCGAHVFRKNIYHELLPFIYLGIHISLFEGLN